MIYKPSHAIRSLISSNAVEAYLDVKLEPKLERQQADPAIRHLAFSSVHSQMFVYSPRLQWFVLEIIWARTRFQMGSQEYGEKKMN